MKDQVVLGKHITGMHTIGSKRDNDSLKVFVQEPDTKEPSSYSIRVKHLFQIIRKKSLKRAVFKVELADVFEYLVPVE